MLYRRIPEMFRRSQIEQHLLDVTQRPEHHVVVLCDDGDAGSQLARAKEHISLPNQVVLGSWPMNFHIKNLFFNRLEFLEFSIAQPDSETVCSTDNFQVSGATNVAPVICGDNDGQHSKFSSKVSENQTLNFSSVAVYLHVPDSGTKSSNLQLTFNFGSAKLSRRWKIRVILLPCGADYLGI